MTTKGFGVQVVGGVFSSPAPVPAVNQEIPLQLDSAGNILVNVAAGGTSGTQYADGTTQATPTGTVALGKNLTNVLHALALDASGNLNVNIAAGSSSGVQFADNAASGATPTGTLAMGWDNLNSVVRALKIDGNQHLIISAAGGSLGASQGTAAAINGAWPVLITDGTNVLGGTGHPIRIDPTGTTTQPVSFSGVVTVQGDSASGANKAGNPVQIGGVFNTSQPSVLTGQTVEAQATSHGALIVATGLDSFSVNANQIGTWSVNSNQAGSWIVDVSDRAARLLGVVYGSQSQQLKQTATNFNLQVELATGGTLYDARQIRALTSADVVTANQGGAPWTVKPDGTIWTLTGTSANVNVTNNVGVIQQTSPWVDNVSQFGGNNVVTGTGVSGLGIPRVTVSSDSFPVTQAISATALPLPGNAAQETGGNLSLLASQTINNAQIIDLLNLVIKHLQLLNINVASSIPGADSTVDAVDGVL